MEALGVVLILVVTSMKIKTNKIIIIFLVIITLAVILLLTRSNKKEYLSEPIPQTAVSFSNKKVSIKDLAKWVEKEDFYLWEVNNDIKLQNVSK